MNPDAFFRRINISYRAMRAREEFFAATLVSGAVAAIVSAATYAAGMGVTIPLVFVGAGLVWAAARGRSGFRSARAYEPSLYVDRMLEGGERFPALYELTVNDRTNWVYDVLRSQCEDIMAQAGRVRFPLLRGRARYFFVPYIILALVLALPHGEPQTTHTPLPVIGGAAPDGPAGHGAATPFTPPQNGGRNGASMLTAVELEALNTILKDPKFREFVKNLVAGNTTKVAQGTERLSALIQGGDKDTLDHLGALVNMIAKLQGGADTGQGAGLTDRLRDALDGNDLARTAAEFEMFMRKLQQAERRRIVLRMRGRVEEYERTYRPSDATPGAEDGPDAVKVKPVAVDPDLPFEYHRVVQRYFDPSSK